MAEIALTARAALLRQVQVKASGLRIEAVPHRSVVHLAAFRGRAGDVHAAIAEAYGVEPPRSSSFVTGRSVSFVWAGPGAWLAMSDGAPERDLHAELLAVVKGVAAVTDQSDARALFAVSGTAARDCLAKGFSIDMHPRVFKPGDVAVTHAAHIGAMIWQLNDAPSYEIAVPRSFADSFAEWLLEAAAEFISDDAAISGDRR